MQWLSCKRGANKIPELPNVLFAHQNSVWLKLKSIHQPGDEIVRYGKDKVAWKGRYSESGIALVRSGCIFYRLVFQRDYNDSITLEMSGLGRILPSVTVCDFFALATCYAVPTAEFGHYRAFSAVFISSAFD